MNVLPFLLCMVGLGKDGTDAATMSSMLVTGSFSKDGSCGKGGVELASMSGEETGEGTGEGTGEMMGEVGNPELLSSIFGAGGFTESFCLSEDGEDDRTRMGIEGTGSTCERAGDMTGLEGAVLPGAEGPRRCLGITVNEFRDCRRRLARARACVSLAGMEAISGRGDGRISNPDNPRVSGEHGNLGLYAPSERSRTGLVGYLSGSGVVSPWAPGDRYQGGVLPSEPFGDFFVGERLA